MAELENNPRFQLGTRDTLRILLPYVKRHFMGQVEGIWFIVAYLVVFQILVLQLPLVYAAMIAVGILVVVAGAMWLILMARPFLGVLSGSEAIAAAALLGVIAVAVSPARPTRSFAVDGVAKHVHGVLVETSIQVGVCQQQDDLHIAY